MKRTVRVLALIAGYLATGICVAQDAQDTLYRGFQNPPMSARALVWWHWINGNITQEGIRTDLEWMKRVGLGGLQNFDAALGTTQLVETPLASFSPPWNEAFRYAASLADRLGLEFGVNAAPGFSQSGGPWVKPESAMKKLVWSETRVRGSARQVITLPRPPQDIGPFQDVAVDWSNPLLGHPPSEKVAPLYRDIAVVAYRVPAADPALAELEPVVTSSAGPVDADLLWDGKLTRSVSLPLATAEKPTWIQLDFGSSRTVQSLTLGLRNKSLWDSYFDPAPPLAELQSSQDGAQFQTVTQVLDGPDIERTITFAPVTARIFRLVFKQPPMVTEPLVAALMGPRPSTYEISELQLSALPKVDHFEEKAGFFSWLLHLDPSTDRIPTREIAPTDAIKRGDILILTSQMHPDGTLDWYPPQGEWVVLRLGYSLLGITNHPAPPSATGLEVDKLDAQAVRGYIDTYLDRLESVIGSQASGGHGLKALVSDSYEAGPQNWTPALPEEFARRRGYDLLAWLPVLTGRIVESSSSSERFLWDFRRTLGELMAENHYGQMARAAHAHSMIYYSESQELARAFIGDGMDAKRIVDVPMGAMWIGTIPAPQEQYDADLRESSSVAHIYGQTLTAAESMTTLGLAGIAYTSCPESLKSTADRELAEGVNRFVIHTSVHQPLLQSGPGMTLGPFGQWFTRNETWSEQATPWLTYLARSAHLMQQGMPSPDLLYFYGQDSTITALYARQLPQIPEGYGYDFASAQALDSLSVEEGSLVAPSGVRYKALVLDPRTSAMSLDVLRTIAKLVAAGAVVVGDKPLASPSLSDNLEQYSRAANEVWGSDGETQHQYLSGRVIHGMSLSEALLHLGVPPDFTYTKPASDTTVWFTHRHLRDGDVYFLSHRNDRLEQLEARFRVTGRAPQLWHADSGRIERVSFRTVGRETIVPLSLEPNDAVFVVFRQPTSELQRQLPIPARHLLTELHTRWTVHFPAGHGAPEQIRLAQLQSWTHVADAGVKYFSGTASYEAKVFVPTGWLKRSQRVEIDLGTVKNLASIEIDGKSAGILWKAPFRADVTDFLHTGYNALTVKVTNLWPNRLIGDKQAGATPIAHTSFNPYSSDSPLLDSGLLGPVTLWGSSRTPQSDRTGSRRSRAARLEARAADSKEP